MQVDLRAVARTLAEHPEGSPTMAEIASRLGVAKPTLYRKAGSKDALREACLDAEVERLLDHLRERLGDGESPRARLLERVLRAVDGYADDSPGGFALLFERRAAGADVRVRRAEESFAALLRARSGPDGHEERETFAAALLGAAAASVAAARHDDRALDAAAAARELGAAAGPSRE